MYDFLHVTNILSNGCSNRCDCFWRVRVFSRSQCLPVQIYNTIIPGGKMAVSMEKTLINAKIWVFQSQHGILLLEKMMIPQDWLTWWLDDHVPKGIFWATLAYLGGAGVQPGPCGGELQPIWVTEPNCSKITMSLEGSTRDPFPKEARGREVLGRWKELTIRTYMAVLIGKTWDIYIWG